MDAGTPGERNDQHGDPRSSLEGLDCLGMALTTVSNAWPQDRYAAWVPSQRKPNRGRPALGQWSASGKKARTRAPKATRAFGGRGRRTTCGLRQRWPSSKPFAASAIAPDPFRGWGRQPLACIHTQREPDVSPAGTGTDYPQPKGPPHGSLGGKPSGSPSWPRQGTPIKEMATGAIRGAMTFSSRCPMAGSRGARTVAEGDVRWGSRKTRDACPTTGDAAGKAEGCVGVRSAWVLRAASVALRACLPRTRAAACPCSLDNGCMTRTRHSCRHAGASACRTADSAAKAAAGWKVSRPDAPARVGPPRRIAWR